MEVIPPRVDMQPGRGDLCLFWFVNRFPLLKRVPQSFFLVADTDVDLQLARSPATFPPVRANCPCKGNASHT